MREVNCYQSNKESLFFIFLPIGLFFLCYSAMAQTSLKTGNIRECATWTADATQLNNPTINTGHVVASNTNATSVNSINFNGSGALNINASHIVDLVAPTTMAPCYLNQTNSNTFSDYSFYKPSDPSVQAQHYGRITISGLDPVAGAKINARVRFEFARYPSRIYLGCTSNGFNMSFSVYLAINGVLSGTNFILAGSNTVDVANEMTLTGISVKNGDVLSVGVYGYNNTCTIFGSRRYTVGVTTTGTLTILSATEF